jgi:hypothetical protein
MMDDRGGTRLRQLTVAGFVDQPANNHVLCIMHHSLGSGLMVGRWVLAPQAEVRLLAPQLLGATASCGRAAAACRRSSIGRALVSKTRRCPFESGRRCLVVPLSCPCSPTWQRHGPQTAVSARSNRVRGTPIGAAQRRFSTGGLKSIVNLLTGTLIGRRGGLQPRRSEFDSRAGLARAGAWLAWRNRRTRRAQTAVPARDEGSTPRRA